MSVGLGTYSFFWQHSDRVSRRLRLDEMVAQTARLGADVFQICDYPALERMAADELVALRTLADELGLSLELGTRGIRREHLERYLELAGVLGASLIRTMLLAGEEVDEQAIAQLAGIVPELEARGVTIALETYEQVASAELMRIIAPLDPKRIGVCLDVANVMARYESQREVIDAVADRVVNLHVKDFRFVRADGLVGFSLTGAELGTGDLDADFLFERVRPNERGISQIVEHWLPWQGDEDTTIALERAWTASSLADLRGREQAHKSTG